MNDSVWQASALLTIVAGLLVCFWGYRLLKLSLAIIGFMAGAYGGWEIGMQVFHQGGGVLLLCALIGALLGMVLCIWLYFLGIFLIGATAGTVIAAAFVNGTGQQTHTLLFLALPIVFGVIALVAQKIMISVSTAFSGAYLVTAGLWQVIAESHNAPRVWLRWQEGSPPPGTLGYTALLFWIVLAVAGLIVQLRAPRREPKPAAQKP